MFHIDLCPINVTATFANGREGGLHQRITPHRFTVPEGLAYEVACIEHRFTEQVNDTYHVHFVVSTDRGASFDIVYDSRTLTWHRLAELRL